MATRRGTARNDTLTGGASADVLIQSTLIPLERAINGVPGMRYMITDATSAGEATLQVIFDLGTDPNLALINVKTRIDQVMPQLPKLVQLEGVILMRVMPSMLMYVNVYSTAEGADEKFLFNFANINVLPEVMRVKGIGQARILGSRQYAMRIWLNPDRMRAYNVSPDEVQEAMAEQSLIGRPGRVGQATGKTAQSLEYVLVWEGRYNKPEQYEDIIIRATPDGHILRLKDIAKVELGSEFFNIYSNLDGYPSAAIVLKQTLGSNAQEVIENVKQTLEEIKETTFPPGMDFAVSYDVSRFVDASIEQVTHTLVEAFVLVALVVIVFLGDWRSTLIPTLAVPVSLGVAIFGLLLWTGTGLVGAAAPLIAAELGRRNHSVREVRRTVRMALWLSLLVSLAFMGICAAGGPIMRATGQEPELTHHAASFLLILMWGMFPMIAASVLRIFVSALGRPTIATHSPSRMRCPALYVPASLSVSRAMSARLLRTPSVWAAGRSSSTNSSADSSTTITLKISFFKGVSWRDISPPICLTACRADAAVCESIRSRIASASARSILPLERALKVNSPGSAMRASNSRQMSMTCRRRTGEP